jgi:hypothetical protein
MVQRMMIEHEIRELLIAIARARTSSNAPEFGALIGNIRDWDSLIRVAHEHRVSPLLYLKLTAAQTSVPPEALGRLRAEYDRNVFQSLANASELIAVLKEFDQHGIRALPFKGIVLGASVYRDISIRPAGDLDLLVFFRDLLTATALLRERGYKLMTPVHEDGSPAALDYYEYHFERGQDGRVLELRWRLELTQPRFRRNLGMDWLWPRRRSAQLAGVEVPDLDPESTLLVLCMHGSKHAWSRLSWICDVAQLMAERPNLNWKAVAHEAKKLGLLRSLALGVLLAHRICGAAVPRDRLRRFEADGIARGLADYFQEHLFDEPGHSPEGSLPYNVKLLGFSDRLRMILSLDFMRPNERDKAAVHLPKSLQALYYLVRPFRVFLDKTAR